ncbi:hypothetical protein MTR_7g024230 [Medicago truncatula]|uniref:Uncharacterized protein n=1 Tax=Medicago truncatula TaxID=3880 RepID=G7KWT3_MEDTR|nr:hypothetical protein MTR_7g024230 [Medicago truncatula]
MEPTAVNYKLSIYLGAQFLFEFINFNKFQVYKGFDLSPTRYYNMNIVQFHIHFIQKNYCCFIWLDVYFPILFQSLYKRVDQMVEAELEYEIREIFVSGPYCTLGL